ncbi:MAG: insulinase family protein [Ruminococcus sp.]|nr:insulinase family protein [Ruminococcus sp.]
MRYNRTEIARNIGFSSIIDEKFKTGSLTVRFMTRLSGETAAANALGIGALSSSSADFPTLAKLNEKLSSLYGAGLSTFARKRGDVQILGLTASWLTKKYAFDGEDVDREMLSLIRGCIFSPNVKDGEFDAESYAITKKDLLDRIDAELNNKRGYALSRASEVAFRGEPAEYSCYGSKESAAAVDSAGAYSAYKELLSDAQVEIFYIAPVEDPGFCDMFRESFSGMSRTPSPVVFRTPSPLSSEVNTDSDEYDVRQCKMVMTFKTSSEDFFAVKMLSTIFGETPVSKLFMNVREKMSLCYYCASRVVSAKGAIMVDSGVERANIEKAKAEILGQLEEIKKGNITDSETESALLSIENTVNQIGDTPASYSGWYFERFCEGNSRSPEEQLALYREVTKERIIEAAKSLSLDSVYLMLDKEADA